MTCDHGDWNGRTMFCPTCGRAPDLEALKGIQVSPSVTPSRRRLPYRQPQGPSWEKGRVGETRPDGSWVPYLSPKTGQPMGVKEMAENRHGFETQIKRLKSDPTVFARERA